ncbi:hypothetical protein SNEBB_006159, partial [Seison nebaliae]
AGTQFTSKQFKMLCVTNGIRLHNATRSQHQTIGQVERNHLTIGRILASYSTTNQNEWDSFVHQLTFAFNSKKSSTTGISPFKILYGRELRHPSLPWEHLSQLETSDNNLITLKKWLRIQQHTRKLLTQKMKKEEAKMVKQMVTYYNKKATEHNLQIGAKIIEILEKTGTPETSSKLVPLYSYPMEVVEILQNNVIVKTTGGKLRKLHLSKVIPITYREEEVSVD